MVSPVIEIGDKINLWKIELKKNTKKRPKCYVSQLLDFFEDDKIKIAIPIEGSRLIPLDIGDKYLFCFFTKKGLYQCRGLVEDRYKENNLYVANIHITSDFEKYQRRQYYRLECAMDFQYRLVTEEEKKCELQYRESRFDSEDEKDQCYQKLVEFRKTWKYAVISDISGGGARFNSEEELEKDSTIEIKIPELIIPPQKESLFRANIISAAKLLNKPGFYEYRVEFAGLTPKEREAVIKFVFQEDRRKRRKEKGRN